MGGPVGRIAFSPIEINIEPPGKVMYVAFRVLLGSRRACSDYNGSVVTERPFHDIGIVGRSKHRKIDNLLAVADERILVVVTECVHPRQIVAYLLAYQLVTTNDFTGLRELVLV